MTVSYNTNREKVFDVEPISREQILHLPQLQEYPESIRHDPELTDMMWEVMGGNPSHYDSLLSDLRASDEDPKTVVEHFILRVMRNTVNVVRDAGIPESKLAQLSDHFRKQNSISFKEFQRMGTTWSMPDKILRQSHHDRIEVVVPATNAFAVMLRHGLTEVGIGQLKNPISSHGQIL